MHDTAVYLAPRMLACEEDVAIKRALELVGWIESPSIAGASFCWDVCNPQQLRLPAGIGFSRFPAMQDCCRKALYATVLARLRRLLPLKAPLNDTTLIPRQWALPRQANLLREHFASELAAAKEAGGATPIYIVKPDGGSQGTGIELTTEPCRQSPYKREAVVQEYIATPMLLDGLKFDLRLFVLVTSVGGDADDGPMRSFLCREGMVRFATTRFDGATLDAVHAHLTNYHLNKQSKDFQVSDEEDGGDGSKRTVSSVFAALAAAGLVSDVEGLWDEIGRVVTRALTVVQPILASARSQWSRTPCFQVLGFDILLDSDAKPWLIEINDHPSLRIDRDGTETSAVDVAIKVPMLADVLRIIAEINHLQCRPRDEAPSSFDSIAHKLAFGTSFVELTPSAEEAVLMSLFDRLRYLFDWHVPPDAEWATARKPIDSQTLPGPRWKAQTFTSFMQAQGTGLSSKECEAIFVSVCGKGGAMDILDFAEACAQVARCIFHGSKAVIGKSGAKSRSGRVDERPRRSKRRSDAEAASPPVELIVRLLDRWRDADGPGSLSA